MKLSILDTKGEILFSKNLFSIPLKHSVVKKKCLELFSDSEPCILCISYAQKSVYLEIDSMLRKNSLIFNGLDLIQNYFDLSEKIGIKTDCLENCTFRLE